MRKFRIAAWLIAAACLPAAADTLQFSLAQAYVSNLFQTSVSGPDWVTVTGLSWDKSLSSFSLFAAAEYSRLWENSGLSDLDLSVGADYVKSLGSKTALYFALEGQAVRFGEDFVDFNRSGGRFTASLKSYLSPSSILKATAVTEYRAYSFSPFDFVSQGAALSLDKYFASRTTLKAELSWGYKYFLHPWLTDSGDGSEETETADPASSLTPAALGEGPGKGDAGQSGQSGESGGGSGNIDASGKGPGSPKSENSGKGVQNASWRGERVGGYAYASMEGGGSGIQVAAFNGTIAQGLGDRVGLRLAGVWQWTLSGRNPFTTVEEFTMIENPTYDTFAWQGFGWNAQATALLPWNIELRLGYTWTDKEFPGIEALGLDGLALGATRRDRRGQIEARLKKTFAHWTAVLTGAYIRNGSNDPLYEWSGPAVSLSLDWHPGPGKKP
ncbi:MAG: hypothetical protein PHI34_03785 [Acidobacteriota bacterium]|nr:hypothetical protein [Acidobacteriota bacterium]